MNNNIGEARRSYALTTEAGAFTQEDAAKEFGVGVGAYRYWEQGKGKLNGEILCAIADKYGTSTDYLLCRTDDPTPYPAHGGDYVREGDEARMVSAFRKCTKREKATLVNTAETMADKGLAKNNDLPESVGAVSA